MTGNLRDFDHQQEQSFNYQEFLYKCYHYWYLFALSVILVVGFAYFFNKYARPEYEVHTTLLIKDRNENRLNPQEMLGMGSFNNLQNLQNEMEVLASYNLVNRTVQKTGYEVSYFGTDRFLAGGNFLRSVGRLFDANPFYGPVEVFRETPFRVIIDTTYPQPVNITFRLTFLSRTTYKLEADALDVWFYDYSAREFVKNRIENVQFSAVFPFGQLVHQRGFRFKVVLAENFDEKEAMAKTWSFRLRDYDGLVSEFRTFRVEPVKKEASVVSVTMKSTNPEKAADFLDALAREYLASGLEKKNMVATRTIDFIDRELAGISDSLSLSERALTSFRTSNEIMNLDEQSQQAFQKMMELQDAKAALMVKNSFLKNLKKYIESNQRLDEMIVPASLGLENQALNALTIQLTDLYIKRSEAALYTREGSPNLVEIDNQVSTTRKALYSTTLNTLEANQLELDALEKRISAVT